MTKKGVPRVVWRRLRKSGGEGIYDSIPFLSVSRSLGDFWSFNPRTKCFTVSPKPDVHVHPLNPKEQRFIVIASDGLWNVMSPDEVVQFIWDYEHDEEECCKPRDVVRSIIEEALRRWEWKRLPADNIAVLIAFLTEAVIDGESTMGAPTSSSPIGSHERLSDGSPASSSPIGKHERLDEGEVAEEAPPAEKRLKLIEEPTVVDDDSGVCSDDNALQPAEPASEPSSSEPLLQPTTTICG